MTKFENIMIKGLGNLSDFDSIGIEQVQALIQTQQNYALYIATAPIPAGWPTEIMQSATAFKEGEHHPRNLNQWYMNLDGVTWKLFYSYDLDAYLSELQLRPAFIYEKISLGNNLFAFKPLVSLLIADDGCIAQASKTMCDHMIATVEQ